MRQAVSEHYPEEVEEVAQKYGDILTEELDQREEIAEYSMPPPYASLMMPGSRAALMAVLDDSGYLVPICTASDLLRGCKYFWRASQG